MSTRKRRPTGGIMDRRQFLRLAGLGGGGLVLVACGGVAPQATSTPQSEEGAAGGQKTTLAFWLPGGSDTYYKAHQEIAKAYTKSNPNITTQVTRHTGDQNFIEVLLARIAAGNPPDATVMWDTPVSLGARGSLTELDGYMQTAQYAQAENWPEAVLQSCQFGGKTYGLPVTAGTYGLWYNQEMFEKKGIPSERDKFPKTWDELRRLSKEFTSWKGDRLETAGFLPWHDQYTLPIWSALNGSQIYNTENRKYTIDSEQNVAMMEYAVSWLDEEYKGDINKVNKSASWGVYEGEQGQPPAFQEGRLASLIEGSWVMGDFYASVKPKFERWNVAQLPVGPGGSDPVSGFWPNWLAMPKGSKNAGEVFKYLDYISGEGVKTWFSAVPDMPTNKKVDPNLLPASVVSNRDEAFARDAMDFFRRQQDISTPMWTSPVQSFGNDQLGRAMERIMTKAAKPKDALAEAQKASQAELEKVLKGA